MRRKAHKTRSAWNTRPTMPRSAGAADIARMAANGQKSASTADNDLRPGQYGASGRRVRVRNTHMDYRDIDVRNHSACTAPKLRL
jgi:hypothetical protein